MKKLLILLLIVLAITTGCYMGITYKIMDADTKQPIKGAVVNVEWSKTHGLPGLTYHKTYKTVEAISDDNGEMPIEGCYDFFVDSPRITIYKLGYVAWNDEFIFPNWERRKGKKWENKTIYLEKFKTKYPILKPEYFKKISRNNNYEWDGSSSFNSKYTHYRHMDFVSSCLIVWSGDKMEKEMRFEENRAEDDRHAVITFKTSGRIVDADTHTGISGAVIKLKERDNNDPREIVSDENGNVVIEGKTHLLAYPPSIIKIEKKGYIINFYREYNDMLDFWEKLTNGFTIELKKCEKKKSDVIICNEPRCSE